MADIADAGGNIVAITSSQVLEGRFRENMVKVTGLSPEALRAVIAKRELQLLDIRSFTVYEPKMCG